MEEPWEALDLDDSDILASTSSVSLLRPCTLHPPHQSIAPSQSLSPPPQQPPPLCRSSPIPGPAAAIQSAMHRKDHFNSPKNAQAAEISTQEYIRRVEDNDSEDFSRKPWVLALDFLRREGGVDATALRDIKQRASTERFDKVVAIVKSCKPNGLGDMMVTLKDPTDTISASVHQNVLTVGELGKMVAVGSVLILYKVVAFYSSYASCYLNITRNNVVKVISADCAVQSFPEASAKSMSVFEKDLEIPQRTPCLIHTTDRRSEALLREVQPGSILTEKTAAEELMLKENSSQAISFVSSRQIENAANINPMELIHIDTADSSLKAAGCLNHFEDDSCRSLQLVPGILAGNHGDLDNAEKLRQIRDFSSAPNITGNLESQCAWQENGSKSATLLRGKSCTQSMGKNTNVQPLGLASTCLTVTENLDDRDISGPDVQKRRQHGFSTFPTMFLKQASQEIHKANDPQKQEQDENGVKKQRLALISRTSVQEWTDEQLDILDMDED